jgi:hypothetical protein
MLLGMGKKVKSLVRSVVVKTLSIVGITTQEQDSAIAASSAKTVVDGDE